MAVQVVLRNVGSTDRRPPMREAAMDEERRVVRIESAGIALAFCLGWVELDC